MKQRYKINVNILLLTFLIFVSIPNISYAAVPETAYIHNDSIIGNFSDVECASCHNADGGIISVVEIEDIGRIKDAKQIEKDKDVVDISIQPAMVSSSVSSSGNYTAVLAIGQTPYQLAAFLKGNYNGVSWWDVFDFGDEKQKNMVYLTIFNNSSGTIKPMTGLEFPHIWPQASYRKYSGSYSYKSSTDPSPISTLRNYPNMADLTMTQSIDLTGASSAILTFWTWYKLERDWDYAYVRISTDGSTWTNIPGTLTTNTNPNGNNLGNGITGNSGGNWVIETMDLSSYVGNKILLQFRFKSDEGVRDEGIYIDDIQIKDGTNIIFSDNAEIGSKNNATFPYLVLSSTPDPLTTAVTLQYFQRVQSIDLREDPQHPGTYYGYFKYDPLSLQYSGNYNVAINIPINSTTITVGTQFKTTLFGCQNCHNKRRTSVTAPDIETSYLHGEGGGMDSCMYICHSGSRGFFYSGSTEYPIYMGPPLPSNPMHVHEMKYGHLGGFIPSAWYTQPVYNVSSHVTSTTCIQCHTSFVHDNTGTDTDRIASYTLRGTNINFVTGTHNGIACENCHGDLSYPTIPQDQYQLQGAIGYYNPTFTSSVSFTDTFIVDVNRDDNLTIDITGDPKYVMIYTIGPVDNTTTGLQGPCLNYPCAKIRTLPGNVTVPYPYRGTWIVKVILLEPGEKIDYTILTNYPIQRKPIIKIPECNECHNSNGQGRAHTTYEIPDWNPGYAHVDVDDDENLDIQCRMCHGAMHNTIVKNCRDCHISAPLNHVITDPQYSEYTTSQCIQCHGDPHIVSSAAGSADCILCHDVESRRVPILVNASAMDRDDSIHKGLNRDAVTDLNPINKKCWACHGDGNEPIGHPSNYNTPYNCTDCHTGTVRGFTPSTIDVVSEHYLSGDQIRTPGASLCNNCHNKSEMMISVDDPDVRNDIVPHYGKKRGDLSSIVNTAEYCNYCHNSTMPPDSFFDVFVDIYNRDIGNHSRYATNPKCQDCHDSGRIHDVSLTFDELTLPTSTICLPCHGPGGSVAIKDKSKHNNVVNCSVCHLGNGKDIHPIKYLNNLDGFVTNRGQGIKCDTCHETGRYRASAIGKLQHSDNLWNGSLWSIGAGRPSRFWDNTSAYTACIYCHGDSKHNASALGRLGTFKGSNIVNVYGTWCGSCHYKNNDQYNNMVSTMSTVGVPPEITKHVTYGNYVNARDGTRYFNHSLNTYNDDRCDDCHYSGTPSNLTKLVHDVRIGGGACMECHAGVDVNIAIFGKHANISRSEGLGIVSDNDCKICHFNVLTMEQMLPGYANFNNTYYCQDCHKSGGRNATQYASIPANLRVDTLNHAKANCQNCHINNNASKYHPNGPIGTAFDLVNNRMRNCYSCHYRTDGARDGIATTGLMKDPFYAPGEDHSCVACHDDYINDPNPRPALSYCNMCHGTATIHNAAAGSHLGDNYPALDTVSITSPVTAGSTSTVRARASSRWMQIARAQYRINNSANTVIIRDWQEMNAEDGNFNGRQEFVVGSISTTGLSGDYKVNIRAMDGGHIAETGGGIAHDVGRPYYPDNGVWTRISTITLRVTGVTPTPTPTPTPEPTWSGWAQVSGLTIANPSIATFNNRLYAMVTGTSERVFVRYMNTAGTWTEWSVVSENKWFAGPSISEYNNRLYAMMTAKNNTIYVNSMGTDGVWSGWTQTPGLTIANPSIATFNNRLYAAVLGTSERAFIRYMDATGTWSGWSPISEDKWLTGSRNGISIAEYNGRLYAVTVAKDNTIYVNSMGTNGIWSGWVQISGLTIANPGTIAFNNRLYTSVLGTSERAFIRYMDTTGAWSGWNVISEDKWFTGPSISMYNNKLYAMIAAKNNSIYMNSLS